MFSMRALRRGIAATVLGLTATTVGTPASAGTYDLAGLWLFNEGSGQVARDLSWHRNHGQLGSTPSADANDPSWVSLPKLWIFKRAALRFDGNDRVRVPNAPSLEPDGVTVVARVRATGSPGAFRYVVGKGALACETASYGLYTGRDGGLRFYVSDGSSFTLSTDAGQALWDGDWHKVVGRYDGTSVRLSVDGTALEPVPASIEVGYGLPSDDALSIGDYGGPCSSSLGFVGDIDGVAVVGSYETSSLGVGD
jgi:hypothetical protein